MRAVLLFLVSSLMLPNVSYGQRSKTPSCEQGAQRLLSDISNQGVFNWVYANDPSNLIGRYIWAQAKATVKTWKQELISVREIGRTPNTTSCTLDLQTVPSKQEGLKFVKDLIQNKDLAPGLAPVINHPTIREMFSYFVCGSILTMTYDVFYDAKGIVDITEKNSSELTKSDC